LELVKWPDTLNFTWNFQ